MQSHSSHGWLSLKSLAGWATLPAVVALGAGLWLAVEADGLKSEKNREIQGAQNFSQARALADSLFDSIQLIRAQAFEMHQIRFWQARLKPAPSLMAPQGKVLYWAELETMGNLVSRVVQSARNPAWKAGASIPDEYFEAAAKRIHFAEFRDNGVAVLRMKQDPARSNEWMGMAFPVPPGGKTILFVLVDPAEVFPAFKRFATRGEGGNLRGYLVGSDGMVIAHSQKAYVGSDFSSLPVFQEALRDAFQNRRQGGSGLYEAIDKLPVATGYARMGTLPLTLVVERVTNEMTSFSFLKALSLKGFGALLLVAASAFVAALALQRRLRAQALVLNQQMEQAAEELSRIQAQTQVEMQYASSVAAQAALAASTGAPAVQSELNEMHQQMFLSDMQSVPPEPVERAIEQLSDRNAASQLQAARLEKDSLAAKLRNTGMSMDPPLDSPSPEQARPETPAAPRSAIASMKSRAAGTTSSGPDANPGTPVTDPLAQAIDDLLGSRAAKSQFREDTEYLRQAAAVESEMVETALARELALGPDESRTAQEERIMLAHLQEATTSSDPRKLAYELTNFSHRLYQGPSLFFAYHDRLKAGILSSAAGLDSDPDIKGVSFPVLDELKTFVLESARAGQMASLSDYSPLGQLLLTHFKAWRFQAWPVTGAGGARLLGILVILAPDSPNSLRYDSLSRVIRTTGLMYEKTLLMP